MAEGGVRERTPVEDDYKRDEDRDRSRRRERDRDYRDRDRDRRDRDRDSRRDRDRDYDRRARSRRSPSSSQRSSSPRTRSEDAPSKRLRRSDKWDQPPPGFEGMNPSQIAQMGVSAISPFLSSQQQQQQRQSRRLYVGNIPADVTEQALGEFISTALLSANLVATGNPVLSVQLNHERNFAFVEFRSSEDTVGGLALDGIAIQGQTLKIRRPKDYVQTANGDFQACLPGITSTQVPDTPNKLFIGGLPSYLNDEQVKELLVSFGQLKSFNLVKDSVTNQPKGYAFFEYTDPSVNDRACQGLNGLQVGDKTLLVQAAHLGSKKMGLSPFDMDYSAGMSFGSGANTTPLGGAVGGITEVQPTRIVMLMNMVTLDDLKDDAEFDDVLLDVKEECEKFGTVQSIEIPRPPREYSATPTPGIGKIFVEYVEVEGAQKAQQVLQGRKFAGRTVLITFFPEEKYAARNFSSS